MDNIWDKERQRIIGLGEDSFKKSYYPELQNKINELEASNNNLNTIFNSTSDCIIIHDIEGNILLLNKQSQALFNIKNGEESNNKLQYILINDYSPIDIIDIWTDVIKGYPKTVNRSFFQQQTNNTIYIQSSMNRVMWYGKVAIVEVIRDITEHIKYEHELKQAKEKAEESTQLKTAFLANLSHEIRTPMNGIIGFAELLQSEELTPLEHSHFVGVIQQSGERMLRLISDLVDISKIESGTLEKNLEKVNLNQLIFRQIDFYQAQCAKRGLTLTCNNYLINSDSNVITDALKLEQVLSNLLGNAVKFTHQGFINLGYSIENNDLLFWVKDSGDGISKDMHQRIFERFMQANHSNTHSEAGSGLGLAISKAFIELFGGKIWVESELGKGTTFFFTLPYLPATLGQHI